MWQGLKLELSRAAFKIDDIMMIGEKREMTSRPQKGCGRQRAYAPTQLIIVWFFPSLLRETFTSPRGSTTLKHFPLQSKFVGFRLAAPPGARLSLASRLWPVGGEELCRRRIIGGRRGGSQHPGKLDHHLRSPHLTSTWTTGKGVVGEPKLEKGWTIRTAMKRWTI